MTKRLLFIILFSAIASGQTQDQCPSCTVMGGHLVAGGHATLGNFGGSTLANGMSFLYDVTTVCTTSTAACTFETCSTGVDCMPATTSGAALIVAAFLPVSAHINTAYLCNTSSGCNAGNATATFSLCPSTNCAVFNGTMNYGNDAAYLLSAPSGSRFVTINLSATQTSAYAFNVLEVAPPPGYVFTALDSSGAGSSSSCSPCTLGAPTLTATDLVFQYNDFNGAPAVGPNISSPYITDGFADAVCLDCNSATAPTLTLNSGTGTAFSWLALSTSAGVYAVNNPITLANHAVQGGSTGPISCSPACAAFTIPSTTAGNLLRIAALVNGTTTAYISSVSGCGSWTVTGANSQNTTNGISMSAATYNLSATGSCTSITVTMNKTITASGNNGVWISYWEVHKTFGSWTFDTAGGGSLCTSNASGLTDNPGQALSLSNTSTQHAIFQDNTNVGGAAGVTLYPWTFNDSAAYAGSAYNGSTAGGSQNFGSDVLRLNTTDGTAPTWEVPAPAPATGVCADAYY